MYGILGQVWYLIVLVLDLCRLSCFHRGCFIDLCHKVRKQSIYVTDRIYVIINRDFVDNQSCRLPRNNRSIFHALILYIYLFKLVIKEAFQTFCFEFTHLNRLKIPALKCLVAKQFSFKNCI